jgi:hypothetical protein
MNEQEFIENVRLLFDTPEGSLDELFVRLRGASGLEWAHGIGRKREPVTARVTTPDDPAGKEVTF